MWSGKAYWLRGAIIAGAIDLLILVSIWLSFLSKTNWLPSSCSECQVGLFFWLVIIHLGSPGLYLAGLLGAVTGIGDDYLLGGILISFFGAIGYLVIGALIGRIVGRRKN